MQVAMRLGYGPRPGAALPAGPEALLARLEAPDAVAARWPMPAFDDVAAEALAFGQVQRAARAENDRDGPMYRQMVEMRRDRNRTMEAILARRLARAALGDDPLRERLVWFWADHFTVRAREERLRPAVSAYAEEAIRPHVAGRFADMLKAAVLHPMMLLYLDQTGSVGPRSTFGVRQGRGLNENLARELLELHTLGVGAGYTQEDVRQLAKLLTGLAYNLQDGLRFLPQRAEPGAETVLGVSYGGWGSARIEDIEAVLEDLAARPETARHLAWKLAVHFVADEPDAGLVAHLAAAFRAGDGQLLPVCAALAEHPATWAAFGAKVRQPFEFIAAGMAALGAGPEALAALPARQRAALTTGALARMGQPWEAPPGPDGWAEAAGAWITPQGLAARIEWAMAAPDLLLGSAPRPDPREMLEAVLGDLARGPTREAVAAAEAWREGIALIFASPEFNRR
jgi:uncharacterized protein (DUF1800 family)